MAVPSALPDPRRLALATRIQALFVDRGQTLYDPRTAEVFETSMAAAQMIIDGARGTGVIDARAHEVLADFLDAAAGAPQDL